MKMITKRGIFLWILCALFIAGIGFLTFSLVTESSDWVMKTYNRHVYSDGQLIDPTTGEVITEDSDGYDVPVSGILENGAAGDSGGDTQNPME
mgnify:CR=1 FL=1